MEGKKSTLVTPTLLEIGFDDGDDDAKHTRVPRCHSL